MKINKFIGNFFVTLSILGLIASACILFHVGITDSQIEYADTFFAIGFLESCVLFIIGGKILRS